jgi:hypothetical protein
VEKSWLHSLKIFHWSCIIALSLLTLSLSIFLNDLPMTKRILLSALFLAMAASMFAGIAGTSPRKPTPASAPQPSAQYNAAEVDAAMQQLNALESVVLSENATLEEVKANQPEVLKGLNLKETSSPLSILGTTEDALGIPSFLWGCVLNWVGILIVYLITEDKGETKKALFGCIASSLFWILLNVILAAAGLAFQ